MVVAPKNRIRFIAFDTETTGLSVYKGHRPFLFIYFDGNKTITTKNPEHVRELLEDPTVGKIMHNAIFDMGMMRSQGIEVRGQIFDTMIMAHLFDENLPKKSLDYCAAKFLNEKKLGATVECWLIENKYTKKLRAETGRSYYELVPDEIMLPYASRDAELTYELFMFFSKRLIAMQLWDLVISECNLIAALLDMEWRGVAIDVPYYRMLEAQLLQKKHSLEQRIFQVAGKEFDINSTLQLGQLLEENGVKVPRTDKKRSKNSTEYNYNVDEAFLATINHPLASEVLEYRGVCKNLSTYVQNLLEHQVGGVVHCHLWQIGARTGRFSSFAPNLQNSWCGEAEILTPKGWVRFDALSSDDLVAQYSPKDKAITFVLPEKFHKYIAPTMLHISTEKQINMMVTPDHQCLLQHRKTGVFSKVEARAYKGDYKQLQAGLYYNPLGVRISLPEIILRCAVQADAHVTDKFIAFKFKKMRKVTRLKSALEELGIAYKEYKYASGHIGVHISDGRVVGRYQQYKFFSDWILGLHHESFVLMSNEIFNWDGLYTRRSSYSSKQQNNTEWAQILQVLSGRRAHLRVYQGTRNPHYQIDVCNRDYALTTNFTSEELVHNGYAYCVTVPTGNIVTRYKGSVCVSGNCPKDDGAAIDRQDLFPRFAEHRSALEALFKNIDADKLEFIEDITLEKIKYVCGDSELLSIVLSAWQQGEDTKMIRRGFIARPGFINFYVDYKAMEFRIFADYIEDSELLKRLKNGEDVHQATADMVGISRKQAKTLNFALIYGMGAAALALKLGVTLEQAAEFIRRYFERMPSAKLVIQNIKAVCRKRGYVRNPFMRRRRLASDEVYKAPNALIQGCCADIVKQAMLKIHHRLKAAGAKSGMILMVHDEIVFEIAQDELHLMPELVFIMESWGHMFKVPIDVDVEATTTNWCACQGYELQRITECAATALTAEQLFWKEELEAMHDATLLELESEADAQPGMREFTLGLEWQDVVLGDWYIEHVATVRAESLRQAKQKWADKTGHSIAEAWDRRAQTFKGWKVVEVKHGEGYGCAVNASRESNTN